MAVTINSVAMSAENVNGVAIQKRIVNGVEVFSAKLGVLVNKTITGSDKYTWQNTTGRSVTLTVTVYSYCQFPDDGYCYTYWDVTSTGNINNSATYGAFNETQTTTLTIPNGYYFALYAEHNVTTGTIYVAEE